MILETKRLILREISPEDYVALSKILQDEETMKYYEGAFTDLETSQWLTRQISRYRKWKFGLWAVVLKENKEMIGQCGLTIQPWKEDEVLEIGYLFQRRYWHKGYAIEVCSIIRDINLASQKVALKNGMKIKDTWVKHYRGIDMPHYRYVISQKTYKEELKN